MDVSELRDNLPCAEKLWQASNPTEWAAMRAHDEGELSTGPAALVETIY